MSSSLARATSVELISPLCPHFACSRLSGGSVAGLPLSSSWCSRMVSMTSSSSPGSLSPLPSPPRPSPVGSLPHSSLFSDPTTPMSVSVLWPGSITPDCFCLGLWPSRLTPIVSEPSLPQTTFFRLLLRRPFGSIWYFCGFLPMILFRFCSRKLSGPGFVTCF